MSDLKRMVLLTVTVFLTGSAVISLQAQKSPDHYRRAAALPNSGNVEPIMVEVTKPSESAIALTYSLPDAKIIQSGEQYNGLDLSEADVGNALQSGNEGEPVLPVVPVQVIIPSGYSLENLNVIATKTNQIKGTYRIRHGEAQVPLLRGVKPRKAIPMSRIYDSDNTYPSKTIEIVGVQYKRGVAIAILKVHPIAYKPKSGKIVNYTSISFELKLKKGSSGSLLKSRPDMLKSGFLQVENPEALGTYNENSLAPAGSESLPSLGICNPAQSYQYVIITADSIKNATNDYTVRDLIAQKRTRGILDTIITTEAIYTNYSGVDNQEKIRNFIKDAYTNWGTDFVLLGGDANIIPLRFLYCNSDEGYDNVPSDLYYQCLDGNFNSDNDSYWGEATDGPGGTDVDLLAEVYIGRASAETKAEMSNFVYKTLAYENASESSPYLRQALMAGEYLGFGGVADYATATMEEIRLGSSTHGYTTAGFAASPLFSVDTMYDGSGYTWSASDLITRMNSGRYSIYNHLGHANETYDMKLYNADADALTNTNFFFIYSQGCDPGAFDYDCFAEHLTTSTRHGAFAVVLNARYGWGASNSTDGASQRFDRQFWNAYFGEFFSNLGILNAKSHENNIWDVNGENIRWCMYETNLCGDPQTSMRGRVIGPSLAYSSHIISDAAGGNGDGLVNPGEIVDLNITIANVGTDSATGVTAIVSSTDPYVSVVNGNATFGAVLCCGATKTAGVPVRLSVASNCPTPRTITLSCLLRDGRDSTWTSNFTITTYTSSQVSGYVRTLTGGNPVSGATVSFSGPVTGSVTTNGSGYYMFGGINGTYSVSVSAAGYAPSSAQNITVPPSIGNVNFTLGRAQIAVTPMSINKTVSIGDSTLVSLAVRNDGDLPLLISASAVETSLGLWAPAFVLYDSTHYVPLSKSATDIRQGEPQTLSKGGPDSSGYRWIDSHEAGGPAYVWNNISSTGRLLSTVSGCDDCNEAVSLSFPFPFYGNTFSSCYVGSNGYITFGNGSTQYSNYPLPSTSAPANLIAGFFDDLYPTTAGDIYFQDFGDKAIFQFNGVSIGSSSTYNCTFQIVLNRSGIINFYYKQITGSQNSCTVGIQNGTQTVGLNIVYNASYLTDSLAIEVRSQPKWISVAPSQDTVGPGQTRQLTVKLNSSGLYGGTQAGAVKITHNAPGAVSPLSVPCTLVVDGMRRLTVAPQTINFGSCRVGVKDTAVLTFTNSGNEATIVSTISSTNVFFSAITPLPLTVPMFGNATLRVVYQPGNVGSHTGTLTVNSNAEDNPTIPVALTGSGLAAPQINISPATLTVSLNPGDSAIQTLRIGNPGGDSLTFSRVGVVPSWLSVSPASGKTAAGDSSALNVIIRSSGKIAGTYLDSIQIGHNAPAQINPQTVPVRMTVASVRRLSAQPLSLSFGTVWVGRDSLVLLNLQNVGNDTTTISSITSNNAAFIQTGTLPIKVPPFGTSVIQVRYTPTRAGSDAGALIVSSSAGDNPSITVPLSGSGILGPRITVSQNFFHENLIAGDSLARYLRIVNSGDDSLRVSLTQSVINSFGVSCSTNINPALLFRLSSVQESFSNSTTYDTIVNRVNNGDFIQNPVMLTVTKNVLIIQDENPWGYNVIQPLLTSMGATVTTISSSQIASQNLSLYNVVVIPSVQNSSFYANYRANKGKIETYVQAGGVLEFHCATQGDTLTLPAGMKVNYLGSPTNYVINRNHPITAGVDSILTGSSASHTWFSTVPANATILIKNANVQPTLVTYQFGSGTVVATGMTWEFYYPTGLGNPLMPHALDYCLNGVGRCAWLSLSPTNVSIAAHDSININLFFRSKSLLGGDYLSSLLLQHNAPESVSPITIPCTLSVDGFRRLSASPSSISFGSLWVGLRDTMSLILRNSGNEATQVNSISSSHAAFSVLRSLPFTVQPFDSVVVPVVYQPGSVGNHSGTLTVNSNAADNPAITVSVSGTAISPPSISVSPQQVTVGLPIGGSAQRTVALRNTGGADLVWNLNQSSGGIVSRKTHDTIPGTQSIAYTALHDLTCDSWNDAGNDAFDGFGTPSVSVGGVYSRVCMLEGDSSYTINGYRIRVRNDFAENHIYRSIIEPQSGESSTRSDVTVNFTGNMGSDGSETVYLDSVQVAGRWLRFYVNEVSFPNSDPRVVFLIVPSKVEQRDSVRYWRPSSGYVSMEARNISLPATVYIIPSYHSLTSIKTWFQNDLVSRNNWLSVSPNSGTTPAGQISNLQFSFSAAGLQAGTYYDTIKVMHNAPYQTSPLGIPVMLTVGGSGHISGAILSIGTSVMPSVSGSLFRIVNLQIGSPVTGVIQGNRYRLVLN